MKNYKEVNIELTNKLVNKLMDKKLNTDRWERTLKKNYEKVVKIINEFAYKKQPVLEIGVRVGYLFDHLKEAGFTDLFGVDISEHAIDVLRQRGYRGEVMDIQEFDLKNFGKFSTVIAVQTLEHCPEPQRVVDGIYNHLNEGGIFYVEVPQQVKEKVPTKWAHYYCFTSFEELDSFFDSDRWELLHKAKIEKRHPNIRCVYRKCV